MAAVSGGELEERYGEEMRGWALAGKSWWDVRLALYEAHPELWGRVSDKCMRYWQGAHAGGRQESYVRKRPAAVCEQGSMSDLAPLWSSGRLREALGSVRGLSGSLPGASREPPGASGSLREAPGSLRELSGSLPGVSGRVRESPGSLREAPGSLREAPGSLRELSGRPLGVGASGSSPGASWESPGRVNWDSQVFRGFGPRPPGGSIGAVVFYEGFGPRPRRLHWGTGYHHPHDYYRYQHHHRHQHDHH